MWKKNALVKISGDLIREKAVIAWIKGLCFDHTVSVVVGGGRQINNHFRKKGRIFGAFGPFGRELINLRDKQEAENLLETNRITFQEYFDRYKITVRSIIPVFHPGGVICHLNGDMFALSVYNGFDVIYVVTLPERLEEKEKYFAGAAQWLGKGPLTKIQIKTFKKTTAGV